jgi:DNA-directed RNA polymerase specialized sigma24 family protein
VQVVAGVGGAEESCQSTPDGTRDDMGDVPQNRRFERAELEALYARLEKPLFNVVYRWLWDREETQDVVQEAFMRLWRKREQIDVDRVEALVYRIAINLASNRRRTRKLWRWISLEAIWDRPSQSTRADDALAGEQELGAMRAARGSAARGHAL